MTQHTCRVCGREFQLEPEDLEALARFDLPPVKDCPKCLWKYLLAFWGFGKFRKTTSALSGDSLITAIPASVRFPIYSRHEWTSDAWDPLAYGMEYDSQRSFFEQFGDLQSKVPHPHQVGIKNTNCEWNEDVWNCKNCYLCRSLLNCEDLNYSYRTINCKRSVDLTYCFDTEMSYDTTYCFKCYKVLYSFDAHNCLDSAFLYDCSNVQNSFMCWNLRGKQYHIMNKPYSREEYLEKLKEFDTRSWAGVQRLKEQFWELVAREAVHRQNLNYNSVNSTGNFANEAKNCTNSYFIDKSQNCRHVFRAVESEDTVFSVGSMTEKCALCVINLSSYEAITTMHSAYCRFCAYLDSCEECEYCFGCVGLRKKKYCILNKQYSNETEWREAVERIKADMKARGEWGEFFPLRLAPGGYNASVAHIYFPETKKAVEQMGGHWEEEDATSEGRDTATLPDSIDDAEEDISKEPLLCPETGRRFNIAPSEFSFLKANGIPLPRYHFDKRTLDRFRPLAAMIEPRTGQCHFCGKEMTHYYPPGWNYRKIACIECYHKEVY